MGVLIPRQVSCGFRSILRLIRRPWTYLVSVELLSFNTTLGRKRTLWICWYANLPFGSGVRSHPNNYFAGGTTPDTDRRDETG